jgi:hypothetical protein
MTSVQSLHRRGGLTTMDVLACVVLSNTMLVQILIEGQITIVTMLMMRRLGSALRRRTEIALLCVQWMSHRMLKKTQ